MYIFSWEGMELESMISTKPADNNGLLLQMIQKFLFGQTDHDLKQSQRRPALRSTLFVVLFFIFICIRLQQSSRDPNRVLSSVRCGA